MRNVTALLAAVVAALLLTAMPAGAQTDPPTVPFAGSVLTYDDPIGTDTSDCTLPGAMWTFHAEGPGTFSHLGAVSFVLDHCSKFTGPTSGTGVGEIVITAANGDQLILAEQATFDLVLEDGGPRWSVISMTWQVAGGTGRFFGADGAGTMSGLGDLVASTTAATFTGHISYDASSRSH